MANYRAVSMAFWSDPKVVDDFTPEDKYFYLYLLTNPHTNLCGCYEVSLLQMSNETGYSKETVDRLLHRADEVHEVIRYNAPTKELLILNWSKFNWTGSDKINKPLLAEIERVKSDAFRDFLADRYNARASVSAPYEPQPTEPAPAKKAIERHKRSEYGWVRLSDDEYERLLKDLGESELQRCITYIDEMAQSTGNKNKWKDWNLVIRRCSREGWGKRGGSSVPSSSDSAMDVLSDLHRTFEEDGR